jgi:hypothetical protein
MPYGNTDGLSCAHSLHFPWAPLPWVIRELLSGELLRAMHGLGMTARWPGEWPRFDLSSISHGHYPIYGMVLPHPGDQILLKHLRSVERQCMSNQEYMERMNRRYVLFPKPKELVNANSRSTKDRIPFV